MKQMIVVANHKEFNALRLGLRVAHALQAGGRPVVLGGVKGKIPANAGVETVCFAASATAKTLAAAFKKAGVKRIISLASLPACEAAALAKLPYIYVEPENFKEEKAVKNKKAILQKAKKVLVLGNNTQALNKKMYGANALRVKNPAVWVEHFSGLRPACFKKANNLVAEGKLIKGSGMDSLLAAWAVLAPLHPTWHLTILGEGPQKTALKKLITKYHLQESVEFVAPGNDAAALLGHADIYLHPSAESAEQVLDALASKLPVVAADSLLMRDLIEPSENGYLVAAGDSKAWQAALDELMVSWPLRVGLALQAVKMRDRFPLEVFVSFFED